MIARRLKCERPLRADLTKKSSIVRVLSKSATTPSTSGAITVTSRASRPCILWASLPTAMTLPEILLTATTDGSSTTMPRPRTAMIVLAEPMSIAIESETRFWRALRPRRVLVFPMNDITTIGPMDLYHPITVKKLLLKRSACSDPINFPKIYRLLAVFNHDRLARLQFVATVRGLRSSVADQNLTAPSIRLQSRRSVYSIADRCVFRTPLGADVTDDHFAGMETHPDANFRKALVVQFAVDCQHTTLHRHSRV